MLVMESLGSEEEYEIGYSIEMSGREVVYSVGISIDNGYGKNEGSPLGYVLGTGFRTGGDPYDGIADDEDS